MKKDLTPKEIEKLKDSLLQEANKGNIIIASVDGINAVNLKEFLNQPVDGILYDLNRSELVALTLINKDIKWINDYAVAQVIRELVGQIKTLEEEIKKVKTTMAQQMEIYNTYNKHDVKVITELKARIKELKLPLKDK